MPCFKADLQQALPRMCPPSWHLKNRKHISCRKLLPREQDKRAPGPCPIVPGQHSVATGAEPTPFWAQLVPTRRTYEIVHWELASPGRESNPVARGRSLPCHGTQVWRPPGPRCKCTPCSCCQPATRVYRIVARSTKGKLAMETTSAWCIIAFVL